MVRGVRYWVGGKDRIKHKKKQMTDDVERAGDTESERGNAEKSQFLTSYTDTYIHIIPVIHMNTQSTVNANKTSWYLH